MRKSDEILKTNVYIRMHTYKHMTFVKVVLSCKTFHGFSRTVHPEQFNSMKEVCNYMKRQLVAVFELENLGDMVQEAEELPLHCDDFKFYSDMCVSGVTIIYLCDHVHHACESERAGGGGSA